MDKFDTDATLGTTTAKVVRHILHTMDDDTVVTFEFLNASLFPKAYENMQSLLKDAYTRGYIDRTNEYESKICD